MISWRDLETHRPAITYQLTPCRHCGQVLTYRLPQATYHRHPEDARAGRQPPTHCSKCRQLLKRRNLAN